MKTLLILLISLLSASAMAQTNLSAVMANSSGAIVRPTNLAIEWSDLVGVPTNSVTESVFPLLLGNYMWEPIVPELQFYLTGTNGELNFTNTWYRRMILRGPNQSVFVNLNRHAVRFVRDGMGQTAGSSGIDWRRPVWMVCMINALLTGNAVVRVQLGGQLANGTNIGDLNITSSGDQGMGLMISNNSLFVEANHGTTNRSVSGPIMTNNTGQVSVRLRSSGTNSIAVYTNNVLATNLPFGPTVATSSDRQAWNMSLTSGTNTNAVFMDIYKGWFYVVVE